MPVHERRLAVPQDAFEAFRRLRGRGPAVLLDGRPGQPGAERAAVFFDPFARVVVPAGSDREASGLDPLARLFAELEAYRRPRATEPAAGADAPRLRAGAAGLLGYDLGRHLERLPATARLDTAVPDLWFALFDRGLEIDLATGASTLWVEELPARTLEEPPEKILDRAERALAGPLPPLAAAGAGPLASNFTREAYLAAVERVREHIRDGDVYQVNLSQRFAAEFAGDPLAVYAALRRINPAPYAAVIDGGDFTLLSASPELFLEKRGDRAVTRPIKGTRPRGADAAADARLAAELESAAKDGAELAMIVDLERNDLGKVARFGEVFVEDAGRIERHPTVFHRVAKIAARLKAGVRADELLRAMFPGGSITGCPKIRSMEVIEDLEGLRRGAFTGAIGHLGFDGDLVLNVAIRTLVVERGRAHFHAGGGVVLDSDPAAEYEETLVKASALGRALAGAEARRGDAR